MDPAVAVIVACIILVHVVVSGRPDLPWRLYRAGPQSAYGPPVPDAAGRSFSGARTLFTTSRGSYNLRETPDEIDRMPCHEPNAKPD